MIRRKNEMKTNERPQMRGGDGVVLSTDLVDPSELLGKGRLFGLTTLEPGCSIGEHQHDGEAEMFYILEGEATAYDNGEAVRLYPGDLLYTGDGDRHAIRNDGDKPLRFIALILYK